MKRIFITGLVVLILSGCDAAEDPKTALERQYFAEHQELQQVIEQIRVQGLDVVAKSADAGSIAACVAGQLNGDPMGALVEVEGALQDSVNLSEIIANIASFSEQELSLESLPGLLQQGADTLGYIKHLLQEYDLAELQTQASNMLKNGQTKTQDLGAHLRGLVEQCEQS